MIGPIQAHEVSENSLFLFTKCLAKVASVDSEGNCLIHGAGRRGQHWFVKRAFWNVHNSPYIPCCVFEAMSGRFSAG